MRAQAPAKAAPFIDLVNASSEGMPDFLGADVLGHCQRLNDELDDITATGDDAIRNDLARYERMAGRLGIRPLAASAHAAALRAAGLVATTRRGRTVRHTLTPLGADPLDANPGRRAPYCPPNLCRSSEWTVPADSPALTPDPTPGPTSASTSTPGRNPVERVAKNPEKGNDWNHSHAGESNLHISLLSLGYSDSPYMPRVSE
ncbi:hypothetical protein ACFXPX_18075 [Kitasatospora sp. NPDC059146]|uniref:hypothetical protein n=1 Tax=Kitasatospora sp. NPDC059146 TaxID=3346741 RepID=UPI003688DB0B